MRWTSKRWVTGLGAAAVATGMAVTLVSTAQATERGAAGAEAQADVADFVDPAELPGDLAWQGNQPAEGLPFYPVFCAEGVFPADSTTHRSYETELDAYVTQFVTRTDSAQEAEELADALNESVAACAADWLAERPGSTAGWDAHGPLDAGDAASLYSVFTSEQNLTEDVATFGIGRTGSTVTMIWWGQMGTLDQAPVAEFGPLMGSALDRLTD